MHSLIQHILFMLFLNYVKSTEYYNQIAIDISNLNKTSARCQYDFKHLDYKTLFKIYDSSHRIRPNILDLNFYQLGNFDQCFNIEAEVDMEIVNGKYCLGVLPTSRLYTVIDKKLENIITDKINNSNRIFRQDLNPNFYFGYCVPSSCSTGDLSILSGNKEMQFVEKLCQSQVPSSHGLTRGAIATIIVLGICFLIVIIATLGDIFSIWLGKELSGRSVIKNISAAENFKKLIAKNTESDYLICLDGLRSISAFWIVAINTLVNSRRSGPLMNPLQVSQWLKNIITGIVVSGGVASDTFLVLAGMVNVYTFMKSYKSESYWRMVLKRYVRLTPSLIVILLIYLYFIEFLGNGPLWKPFHQATKTACTISWFNLVTYTENYMFRLNKCLPQAWYLCVEMQLFCLSLPILHVLKKNAKIGLCILVYLAILGIVIPFTIAFISETPAYFVALLKEHFLTYYAKTHTRFGPYIIGMIAGYIIYLFKFQKLKIELKENTVQLLWFGIFIGLFQTMYLFATEETKGESENVFKQALILAIGRNVWALCISAMSILCITGYGGSVNAFLSNSDLQTASKLTYAIFLLHYLAVNVNYASYTHPYKLSLNFMLYNVFQNGFFTYFGALILNLWIEAPFRALAKNL